MSPTFRLPIIGFDNAVSDAPTGQFGELRVVQKTPVLEVLSSYPFSALSEISTIAGSATVTTTGGERRLQTTANGADAVTLDTAKRGRYKPGYGGQAGVGMRIPVLPTGSQECRWGYFDGNDGAYFGVDATGVYVARLTGGVETKIYQSAWNRDKFNGRGASGLTLDLADGNIYQIDFTHYGHGIIDFQIVTTNAGLVQTPYSVHVINVKEAVSIEDPNLPVRIKVENGGTATAFNAYIGGRQFSIVGRYVPSDRLTPFQRLSLGSIGTTPLPLISVRKKAGFLGIPVRLSGVDIITDQDCIVTALQNPTLTSASFGTPSELTAAETAIERDVSATIAGGIPVWSRLIKATGSGGNAGGSASETGLDFEMIEQQPLTLTVRTVTGTGATASVIVRMREDW